MHEHWPGSMCSVLSNATEPQRDGRIANVLPFDQMPEDNADLANLSVDFPRLETDEAESSPVRREDILSYLADEVPDGGQLSWADLRFLRTAQVEESAYWVWRFI